MINPSQLFAARVPRYTSYPTAPHFHPGIGAATSARWLSALPADGTLSFYVHIPFCDTLCWFCGCHTTVVNNYTPVTEYLDLLIREIELVSRHLKPGQRVTHLHFGGGSPTLLTAADWRRLNAILRSHFDVTPGAEIAIEIDPRGFTREMAAVLAEIGVTRASIGVQDCDAAVQCAINRIQPSEVTAEAVGFLRDAGIRSLNIDLIYGLPHQTVAGLNRTIETVLALEPDRLAIFGYAHVPHFKKHQALIAETDLPGLDARFAQAEAAQATLQAHGYVPIGIDHFAKPGDALAIAQAAGRLARNFQGYTTDNAPALIGLGASSISSLPQGYTQNAADVPTYRAAIGRGELPVARGVELTEDDIIHRAVIERLMCDLAVDLDAIAAQHGRRRAMFKDALLTLAPLADDGIVSIVGGRVAITPKWRSATRLVCAAFDAHLDAGARRHALAV